MKQKSVPVGIALLTLLLLAAACAPAAGRQAVRYNAPPEQIINAIAEIGPTMQPSPSYNFFGINAIGERFITLQANTTTGVSLFLGGGNVTLNFTAVDAGGITTLAASAQGSQSLGNDSINRILEQLDARFERAPAVGGP